MKKTIQIFILILFLLPICLFAQTGKIAGRITDVKTGEPIEGVSVFLENSQTGTYTKANGTFLMQNIPTGEHIVHVRFMGYEQKTMQTEVKNDITAIANFQLEVKAIHIEGVKVSANRAVKRETPIAFTDIDQEVISDKYTTQDMPQLLEDVPGLFANTTGIGDAEITMRGFEANKIQVLINGIPVNDPESQKVYWSNWTGLASNVKSVQVQKGAGSSLYGSGAFGGSLNIETMGSTPKPEITVRSSYGRYSTDGDTADGEGELEEYNPYNYNALARYNSGNLFGGKFNYNIMLERKRGDYYLNGTNYDGYSFGLEAQNIIGDHTINSSFLGAPQEHNQVYFKSDPDLFDTLGRSYSRNNHSYQENYYFKPQFSIRDEWNISETQIMMTNVFVTKGDGGGKYLSQDKFDINTGEIDFRDGFLDEDDPEQWEDQVFGKHALYLYQTYGIEVEEFVGQDTVWFGTIPVVGSSYKGVLVSGNGADFFGDPSRYNYSWRNNRISDHFQAGMNTYYQHDLTNQVKMVLGGELRNWLANHIGEKENFRHFDGEGGVEIYENMQNTYDYTTSVINMSGFARFQYKPLSNLNVMADGQYAVYTSNIEENKIEIYDLGTGEPTGYQFFSTKEMTNADSTLKFDKDDYTKIYSFFSPKFGINYNISKYFNVMANYSLAYKEPRTSEWYSGYDGPDGNQMYLKNIVFIDSLGNYYNQDEEHFYGDLKPEKINTIEFGMGYDGVIFDVEANYYISNYKDKIESVTIPVTEEYADTDSTIVVNEYDVGLTLNAGEARHQGLELSTKLKLMNFDIASSLTLSSNRWIKMNVDEIFDMDSDEMIDKVVPFSPETMANGAIGYTIKNLPLEGKMRVGVTAKYWDGYYANYENEYYSNYIYDGSDFVADTTSVVSSKLPEFLEFGANIKYAFKVNGMDASLKLDFNNILNEDDNYLSARVASDYNRGYYDDNGDFQDDYLTGNRYMYLTPAPLFSMFITMEIKF
ncbi:MAG: TonB-dependent receptor [Candidatus Cloacimonetes bacterium]|mgnify:FL=1|jgi:outer membrane receptor protein involved in Fe transport|nr:TonB-dependent receptor [Candidatus Cloacimonadota bacterium]MBT4332570.1 TonB-dependent receptor [Candidatus Cloacimonadota bacterium]MBT4576609.1 TonB-dependent receptor [Candidatus Cloacimonadota bacterium]MBT5419650.1 TonB-dependent receptor [Candidatus Cloacimonadota bacterium]